MVGIIAVRQRYDFRTLTPAYGKQRLEFLKKSASRFTRQADHFSAPVLVDRSGIEPLTSSMPRRRLRFGGQAWKRYVQDLVDPTGLEPVTSSMPWKRSTR